MDFIKEYPFIIAEVAQAHDGSLGNAHAFIDAIASAGAHAVKFQTHIAAAESTLDEPWRIRFSPQDDTRYDYWQRMGFTAAQWAGLADHARDAGLIFSSSPFSAEAVELLHKLEVPFWKVPSGEVSNTEILEAMWGTRKPLIFSSGMSGYDELDWAAAQTRLRNIPLALLQCTTAYPCPPEKWGINQIAALRERYQCPVGFSDHSGGIYAPLAATALGAEILEVHVTLSRQMFGPDVIASVNIEELGHLVEGAKAIRQALEHPVDKMQIAAELSGMKQIFGRSWALREDLPAGTVLAAQHLTLKKPGTGIPAGDKEKVLGRKLRHDKSRQYLLTWDDLE